MISSIDNTQFTVFDVETTGLFPQVHDRIIEIAAIRVDGSGTPLDEYATLVNPNRDLGPTDIHGITAKEVKGAPSFEEIAGDVMSKLAGAVFVGHNVLFDFQFIQAEVMRLGHTLPQTPLLCTMKLAKRVDPPQCLVENWEPVAVTLASQESMPIPHITMLRLLPDSYQCA